MTLSGKYLAFVILGIPIGVIAIVSGEADDSPGLQGLGLILLLFIFIKSLNKLRAIKTAGRNQRQ